MSKELRDIMVDSFLIGGRVTFTSVPGALRTTLPVIQSRSAALQIDHMKCHSEYWRAFIITSTGAFARSLRPSPSFSCDNIELFVCIRAINCGIAEMQAEMSGKKDMSGIGVFWHSVARFLMYIAWWCKRQHTTHPPLSLNKLIHKKPCNNYVVMASASFACSMNIMRLYISIFDW